MRTAVHQIAARIWNYPRFQRRLAIYVSSQRISPCCQQTPHCLHTICISRCMLRRLTKGIMCMDVSFTKNEEVDQFRLGFQCCQVQSTTTIAANNRWTCRASTLTQSSLPYAMAECSAGSLNLPGVLIQESGSCPASKNFWHHQHLPPELIEQERLCRKLHVAKEF